MSWLSAGKAKKAEERAKLKVTNKKQMKVGYAKRMRLKEVFLYPVADYDTVFRSTTTIRSFLSQLQ